MTGVGTSFNTERVFPFRERVFLTGFWTLFPMLTCLIFYKVQLINPKCICHMVETRHELE